MTDDSNIALRWEIPDAVAKFATGRVQSEEFNEGGFRWTAAVERVADQARVTLSCGAVDHYGPWKCEVDVGMFELYTRESSEEKLGNALIMFDQNLRSAECTAEAWSVFTGPALHINGTAIFEFRIRIINSERSDPFIDLAMFDAPNHRSDVILMIDKKKLHVSRELLSIHSPVFETLFFGNFAEKGKEEVEIKDVLYEEFRDLLQTIYVLSSGITDRTVLHILKLADRFQMKHIMGLSLKHLMLSKGIDVAKKLLAADQYRCTYLRDHCLESFTTSAELTSKLEPSPEYAYLSNDTKAAICDRMMKLSRR